MQHQSKSTLPVRVYGACYLLSLLGWLVFCHNCRLWSNPCYPVPSAGGIMKAALRLFLVHGLGLRSANALIKHFKHPERVFDANRDELEALGIPPEIADDMLSPQSVQRAEAEADKARQLGVTII